jgi:hypothetical protein
MSDDRCGEASTLGDGTPASCTLPITHTGNHHDNGLMWNWPPADDRCAEVGGHPGEPLKQCLKRSGHITAHDNGSALWDIVPPDQCTANTRTKHGTAWCQLATGHPEHHTNQAYRWYDARCPAVTFVNSDTGMVSCSLREGHSGDHIENDTGRALHWPVKPGVPDPEPVTDRATHHYSSNDLAGANRDDLLRDLFKRVEQLEQSSAGGAATDDMFAATNRAIERLASGLGEVERRMTALEGLMSGTDLNRQFERLNGAICTVNGEAQERYEGADARARSLQSALMDHTNRSLAQFGRELEGLLNRVVAQILGELKPPLKVICGEPALHGPDVCELDPGHDGRHYCGTLTWPREACGATHPVESGRTCVRPAGHTAAHKSSSREDVRLVWNDEPVPERQEERASGSPAPARCPSQFREGQCLGYAGHDGECSALPGSNGQLEDPAEFAQSTHDRSSDGTPLEETVQRMENNGPWDPDAEEGWKPLGYTADGL